MLREQLERKADAIVGRWFDEALSAYSPEAVAAWTRQRDRFANPVGHGLAVGTRALFHALLEGADERALGTLLDEVVQVRAVQQMTPSAALGFLPRLKAIVREELGAASAEPALAPELARLEERIDGVVLAAFDRYVEHRERIMELRIAEVKRTTPWWVTRAAREAALEEEAR
jgi:hypothetical protein